MVTVAFHKDLQRTPSLADGPLVKGQALEESS
jgi:hypothetical protein